MGLWPWNSYSVDEIKYLGSILSFLIHGLNTWNSHLGSHSVYDDIWSNTHVHGHLGMHMLFQVVSFFLFFSRLFFLFCTGLLHGAGI